MASTPPRRKQTDLPKVHPEHRRVVPHRDRPAGFHALPLIRRHEYVLDGVRDATIQPVRLELHPRLGIDPCPLGLALYLGAQPWKPGRRGFAWHHARYRNGDAESGAS